MFNEPELTAATVIHHVVGDLLYQNDFAYAHFSELVDLAVIHTGLGMLQNKFSFVKQTQSFWDSTYWEVVPRPFLDPQTLAYANALKAWNCGDASSDWIETLSADVKRPLRKSLKFLSKTNDSFLQASTDSQPLLNQSQAGWLAMASETSVSKQIVALRQLEAEDDLEVGQAALLVDKLRSTEPAVVLHAISAVENLKLAAEPIADELRLLAENRDDETRAKAVIALAKLNLLDSATIAIAAKMLDSRVKFVVFAGMFALASLDSVEEPVLKAAERSFVRSLQACDYEFVGLFATAFDRWLSDPKGHLKNLLEGDDPGYLEIALEALENVGGQTATLN